MATHHHARLVRLSRRRAERKQWGREFDAYLATLQGFYNLGGTRHPITPATWTDPAPVRVDDNGFRFTRGDRAEAAGVPPFPVITVNHDEIRERMGRVGAAMRRVAGVTW
jgi:hypothetical protein